VNKINLQVWSTFRLYGKICENCSGAMALCLLQALAMLGCLSNRVGGAYYWLLTFIAVLATVGFWGLSLVLVTPSISIPETGKLSVISFMLFFILW
jgi:hypothetical protein